MKVEQPSKIGKIGYFVAVTGIFFWVLPIVRLIYHPLSLDLWDVIFFVFGALLVGIGYITVRKDAYVKRLGWKFLFWGSSKPRDRIVSTLIVFGDFWITGRISTPINSPFTFDPWALGWFVTIAAILALIIGWALILTEREGPLVQEAEDDTPTI